MGDVVVNPGTSCEVRNTTVTGSINVEGSLLLDGDSKVTGGVEVSSGPGAVVDIRQASIDGSLKLTGTDAGGGTLLVGAGAKLGAIEASGWAGISISDCEVPGIKTKNCKGGIALSNAVVGNVAVDGGEGDIDLRRTTIRGEMSVAGCLDCSVVTDTGEIGKGLFVEKSIGSIRMRLTLTGSISVSEHDGGISLEDMPAEEIAVSGVHGDMTFKRVLVGRGSIFKGNTGSFVAEICAFSEVEMVSPGQNITLIDNSFGFMSLSIKGAQGPVLLKGNHHLDLTVAENNHGVTLSGNVIDRGEIVKNLGNTTLGGNRFEDLMCADNSNVQFLRNDISGLSVGQCAP